MKLILFIVMMLASFGASSALKIFTVSDTLNVGESPIYKAYCNGVLEPVLTTVAIQVPMETSLQVDLPVGDHSCFFTATVRGIESPPSNTQSTTVVYIPIAPQNFIISDPAGQ